MSKKLSKNFKRSEFACRCGCGFDTVDAKLLEVLEDVRVHFGKPIVITSGCRCGKHNKKIGGSKKSKHIIGRAADFKIKDISPGEAYSYLDSRYPEELGLGLYKSWVHIDSREKKARW